MRALRIGVIGLGDICNAYLTNLQNYPEEVELYACACRTPEKARAKKRPPKRALQKKPPQSRLPPKPLPRQRRPLSKRKRLQKNSGKNRLYKP